MTLPLAVLPLIATFDADQLNALRDLIDARLAAEPDPVLSEREAVVLRLIALGFSNKEIAARLRLSVKTVETYKSRSTEKLHLRSRPALVRYAVRRGWMHAPEELPAPAPVAEPVTVCEAR